MKKIKVFDLPTRIMHWSLASIFFGAYIIASLVDDDSKSFSFHMLFGVVVVPLFLYRLVWWACGTHYAKLSSLPLAPKQLLNYFLDLLRPSGRSWLGHNPASAWSGVSMWILAIACSVTGLGMTLGNQAELFEEMHEVCVNLFLFVVSAHLVGIILHTLKHRDGLGLSMLTGDKYSVSTNSGIEYTGKFPAIILIVILVGSAVYLVSGFDSQNTRLRIFGYKIHLSAEDEQAYD